MNNYLMATLTIIAIGLFSFCLLFWSKKYGNLEFNQLISIITLFFSCIMIFLMLVTIQSGQKDTDKYIEVLKKEVTKQINENQEIASRHIMAIKNTTDKEIAEIKEIQKEKKRNRLKAFQNELTLNINIIAGILKISGDLKDSTKYQYIPSVFKTTTYYYDLIHDIPLPDDVITETIILYDDLYQANLFLRSAMDAYVIQGKRKPGKNADCWSSLAEFNDEVVRICKRNSNRANDIMKELKKIEKELAK